MTICMIRHPRTNNLALALVNLGKKMIRREYRKKLGRLVSYMESRKIEEN